MKANSQLDQTQVNMDESPSRETCPSQPQQSKSTKCNVLQADCDKKASMNRYVPRTDAEELEMQMQMNELAKNLPTQKQANPLSRKPKVCKPKPISVAEANDESEESDNSYYWYEMEPNCDCAEKRCIRLRYCGLANLGFTCYSNSVLQLMYQTPLLRDYFTKANSERGPFHRLLNRLFDHMEHKAKEHEKSNDVASVEPQEFNEEFRKIKPDFESGRQHDAQEFMTILIEMVHQEANQAKKRDLSAPMLEPKNAQEAWEDHLAHVDNSYLASVLMGQVESTLSCLTCGNKSLSWSTFWQLAMHIPPEKPKSPTFSEASAFMKIEKPPMSLLDCIREFTAEETLDNDAAPFCSKCAKRRSATKSQSICRVPPLLLFHLKRFTATGSKIHRQVALTDRLYLGGEQFKLHGVILHKGDEITGHYITMVRQCDQHWAYFDDHEVYHEMPNEHADEFEMQPFAYLCLYKKM